jgi:hypothetical protein
MPNVYAVLPIHSFRGIPFPVETRSVDFGHESVQHAIEYQDKKVIELTAGGNDIFRYRIPARDGLTVPAYEKWYTNYYSAFIAAIKDRSPGKLVDSIRGEVRVKPLRINENSDPTKLDGVDFDVEFIEAPEFEEIALDFDASVLGVVALSESIDEQAALVPWQEGKTPEQLTSRKIEYKEAEPPKPTINPIDAVTGVLRRSEFAMQQPAAIFGDANLRMEKLEDAIDDHGDPQLFGLQTSTRSARLQTYRAKRDFETNNGRARFEGLREEMTTVEAANQYGMTVDEFLRMNPSIARYVILPKGTRVTYVTSN